MMSTFTANTFLDNEVGPGVQPVLALLQNAGIDPPQSDAVRKWRERDSMPAIWFGKVLYALEVTGTGPISLQTYFNSGGTKCLNEKPSSSGAQQSVFD
jgi:hypothetical protein